jgi:hypothetical protein
MPILDRNTPSFPKAIERFLPPLLLALADEVIE